MIKKILHVPPKNIVIGTSVIITSIIIWFAVVLANNRSTHPTGDPGKKSKPSVAVTIKATKSCNEAAKTYQSSIQERQIIYIDNCFLPNPLTIKSGESVIFTNKSNQPMWVISENAGKDKLKLSNFNSGQAWNNGESYGYTFEKRGTFVFYNKEKPDDRGKIIVK